MLTMRGMISSHPHQYLVYPTKWDPLFTVHCSQGKVGNVFRGVSDHSPPGNAVKCQQSPAKLGFAVDMSSSQIWTWVKSPMLHPCLNIKLRYFMVFHRCWSISTSIIHIWNCYYIYIYVYVYLYAYIKLFSFVISHIWKRPKWSSNFPCGPWGHWAAATVALLLARWMLWMLVNVVKALPAPKLLSQVISLVSKWFQDVSEKTRKLETMGTMGTSSMQPKNRPT